MLAHNSNSRLNTENAAAYLGVSPATLRTWRCTGARKIPFEKVGRHVYYRIAVLDRHLAARTFTTSAQARGQ